MTTATSKRINTLLKISYCMRYYPDPIEGMLSQKIYFPCAAFSPDSLDNKCELNHHLTIRLNQVVY